MKSTPASAAVVLLLAGWLSVVAAPAQAAACSGTSGVTEVVQFPDGHTEIGCAPGDPQTGLDALQQAGFPYQPVPGQDGAVCTINSVPKTDCWGASYWAYFHGTGGSWTYSTLGGASYDPKPGDWEGWRFGSGEHPTTLPPRAVASPAPTPRPTGHPRTPASTTPSVNVAAPRTSQPSATGSPKPAALATSTASGPAPATRDTATPRAGLDSSAPVATPTVAPSAPATSSGGGLSWIVGVVLLAVLVASAVGVAVMRRRT